MVSSFVPGPTAWTVDCSWLHLIWVPLRELQVYKTRSGLGGKRPGRTDNWFEFFWLIKN